MYVSQPSNLSMSTNTASINTASASSTTSLPPLRPPNPSSNALPSSDTRTTAASGTSRPTSPKRISPTLMSSSAFTPTPPTSRIQPASKCSISSPTPTVPAELIPSLTDSAPQNSSVRRIPRPTKPSRASESPRMRLETRIHPSNRFRRFRCLITTR